MVNWYKKIKDKAWLGWKGDPLGIVQETKIWTCWQMVYAQTRICPRKRDALIFLCVGETEFQRITKSRSEDQV